MTQETTEYIIRMCEHHKRMFDFFHQKLMERLAESGYDKDPKAAILTHDEIKPEEIFHSKP